MTIHREGYPTLLLTLVVLTALNVAFYYLLPEQELAQNIVLIISLVLFLMMLQFFRDPHIEVQIQDDKVLAPADGKVVAIEETFEDEYFKDKRKQVSIFMSPFNVHVNRHPISGVVKYFRYHPGLYLVAWHPKASTDNERTTIVVQHNNGTEILFRQIAGALARRICWYVEERQRVVQGTEFGFIKFGSRVDVFLPIDAKVTVQLNHTTTAGKTIIAEIG